METRIDSLTETQKPEQSVLANSPNFVNDDSVSAELNPIDDFIQELYMAINKPSREAFEKLRRSLSRIEYNALVDRSAWKASTPPQLLIMPVCSAPNCNDTYSTPGGLYSVNGKWLCRAHLPPTSYTEVQEDGSEILRQSSPPVGYTKPESDLK